MHKHSDRKKELLKDPEIRAAYTEEKKKINVTPGKELTTNQKILVAKMMGVLKPGELVIRDSIPGKLYSNTEKTRTLVRVITDPPKDGGYYLYKIVFWADLLGKWLPLLVRPDYVLSVDTAGTLATFRRTPNGLNDDSIIKKETRRIRRQAVKQRKLVIAQAKRKGKTPDMNTALRQTKNVDQKTGIRIGTRKWQIAQILLSGKSAKIMLADLHALVAKFVVEKPSAQYKITGLKAYTDWLVRWTCRSGRVNSEVFTPALKALGLSEKYARTK